jgi:hypothetical protein
MAVRTLASIHVPTDAELKHTVGKAMTGFVRVAITMTVRITDFIKQLIGPKIHTLLI